MKHSLIIFSTIHLLALVFLGFSRANDQASGQAKEAQAAKMDSEPHVQSDPSIESLPLNQIVLEALRHMPVGGGYSVKRDAMTALRSAVSIFPPDAGIGLNVKPEIAKPSFCSGATYLAFLATIETLISQNRMQVSHETLTALLVNGQADGEGAWGRWNANGPGTARLFYELGLGESFSSIDSAKPGDFMKIFWTDEIGVREAGHSVVYLGRRQAAEGEVVRFWSSNTGVGFSEKEVPLTKMKRVLVTRLERPERLQNLPLLPKKDDYLATMLTSRCSADLMLAMVGVKDGRFLAPASVAAPDVTSASKDPNTRTGALLPSKP